MLFFYIYILYDKIERNDRLTRGMDADLHFFNPCIYYI